MNYLVFVLNAEYKYEMTLCVLLLPFLLSLFLDLLNVLRPFIVL